MSKQPKVEVLLERCFEEIREDETELMFKCMSKTMKEAKKWVSAASPPGPNGYAQGWTIRTKRLKYGFQGVIWNKTHPGLTHLLEKSHAIKNQYGEWGRTSPGHGQVVHIGPVRDKAEDYLLDMIIKAHDEW